MNIELQCTKLPFSPETVEFFANMFFAKDHFSEERNFFELHKTLLLWQADYYHVYAVFMGDDVIGVCHGTIAHTDFIGHLYFSDNYRGQIAKGGLKSCMDLVHQEFTIKRFIAYVIKDNRRAKIFLTNFGFVRDNDAYVYEVEK